MTKREIEKIWRIVDGEIVKTRDHDRLVGLATAWIEWAVDRERRRAKAKSKKNETKERAR